MASTSIQFIQNPPYSVDFRQYSKDQPVETISLAARVKSAVAAPFIFVKVVFVSMAKAGYTTLSHSGTSFKYIVLGYYGNLRNWRPPSDIYLVVFKVVFWVATMGWCFVATTARLVQQHTQSNTDAQLLLSSYAGDEIDVAHIVTHDLEIDVSGVPAAVTVNGLLDMFDQINFDRPLEPGYIAPVSRQEGGVRYTPGELKESLRVFVHNVNHRVAFLATPPAYDMPRLLAFYQQMEDAVRFSIQKSNQDLIDFQHANGNNPETYQGAVLVKYKNLLEDRARIPLMLAIAGKHCGSRYMGESMELYDACENGTDRGTLRDTLIAILAAQRKDIAKMHIEQHLAKKDSRGNPILDTHNYTNYMSSLGKILAIPGTANVIEHLSQELNRPHFLRLFFQDYTVDSIQETVQTKIRESGALREKISDWLKTQPGGWQPAEVVPLNEVMDQANKALADNEIPPDFVPYKSIQNLQGLIEGPIGNLDQADWDEFLSELFVSKRNWLSASYPNLIGRRRAEENIRALFSDDQLGQELIAKTKEAIANNQPLAIESFREQILALRKRGKLCVITGLNADTAMRVVTGKKPLEQALREQQSQFQSNEFLDKLNLEEIAQNGLSPQMLEWILVSQGILLTQAGE